jgi:tetratricopeptide (TPR) repeat protein
MRWLLTLAALTLFAQSDDPVAQHAEAAAAAMKSERYAVAEQEFRAVLNLRPDMAEARMNLGLSCFLQKKYPEAIDAFTAVLKQQPAMDGARLFSGISHFQLNQTAAALPLLRQYARAHPADFQGQYYLGLTALALEQFSDAEQALNAAHSIDPKNTNASYHLAECYLGEARRTPARRDELARKYQEAVAQIAAADPNSYRLAQLRAGAYEADGRRAEAIQELENILRHDPRASGLHYTLACLLIQQRSYETALSQLKAELQLDGPYPRTYLQLGHVYVELQKPGQAVPFLEKSLQADPASRGLAWAELGRAYRALDENQKSLAAFQKAVAQGESNSSVYYQLAMVAKKAGNLELSREALAKSQQLRASEPKNTAPLQE